MTLIVLTVTVQIVNTSINYKPWISNSEYEKLTWISNHKQNETCIFVLYFDKAEWTYGMADLYRTWIWGIIGVGTNVYFGNVEYLLNSKPGPTPSESYYVNITSWSFWNDMEDLTLNGTSIYLIEEWYSITPHPDYLRQIDNGIYWVEIKYN